jgi:hypothetical protein
VVSHGALDHHPHLRATSSVNIYHPKVSYGVPVLRFSAFPSAPGSNVVGVPLGLVLDACFIVAGNQRGMLRLYGNLQVFVSSADSDPAVLLGPVIYEFVVVLAGGYANCVFWIPSL